MSIKKVKKSDPQKTRNGRDRLTALTIAQLNKLLETTQRPKIKVKIAREILRKEKAKEKNHAV
jgi:hypothetical protein